MKTIGIQRLMIGLLTVLLMGCIASEKITSPASGNGLNSNYTGSSSAATVTSGNAVSLVGVVVQGKSNAGSLGAFGALQLPVARVDPVGLAETLADQAAFAAMMRTGSVAVGAMQAVTKTINGSATGGAGTVVIEAQLDNVTGLGTMSMTMNQFSMSAVGSTMNGALTMNVTKYDTVANKITDMTMTFSTFTIQTTYGTATMDGSFRKQTVNNQVMMTMNFVATDANGQQMLAENFVHTTTTSTNSGLRSEHYGGRLYDSLNGYVDISTTTPLVYGSSLDKNPSIGGPLVLMGTGGTQVRMTPQSSTTTLVEADTTGDGVFDFSQNSTWAF